MTDITEQQLVSVQDRRINIPQHSPRELFRPRDHGKLSADLQQMANDRARTAAAAANLRLG